MHEITSYQIPNACAMSMLCCCCCISTIRMALIWTIPFYIRPNSYAILENVLVRWHCIASAAIFDWAMRNQCWQPSNKPFAICKQREYDVIEFISIQIQKQKTQRKKLYVIHTNNYGDRLSHSYSIPTRILLWPVCFIIVLTNTQVDPFSIGFIFGCRVDYQKYELSNVGLYTACCVRFRRMS